jgi:hypothetical protein
MIEMYVLKLIRLINAGYITVDDIKDPIYKVEVILRLNL